MTAPVLDQQPGGDETRRLAGKAFQSRLDAQAVDILHRLRPGDLFTLRDEKNVVCQVTEVRHPIECLPLVRAYEMEGPRRSRTRRMFRAISLDRVDKILPEE